MAVEGVLRIDLDGCLSMEDAGEDERMGCVIVIACAAGAAEARAEREVEPISRVPCCSVCSMVLKNFWRVDRGNGTRVGRKITLDAEARGRAQSRVLTFDTTGASNRHDCSPTSTRDARETASTKREKRSVRSEVSW